MDKEKTDQKQQLYRYYLSHDKEKSKTFYDAIFNYDYDETEQRSVDVDGEILAVGSIRPKILSLHGNLLKTSIIQAPIYKDKDFGEALFLEMLAESSRHDLVSLVYPRHDFDYSNYGFETVVEHYQYNIPVDSLPKMNVAGIVMEPEAKDLLAVYQRYTDHFTGYFERSVDEFEKLIKIYRNLGGGVLGFYGEGQLEGYAFYIRHQSFVEVSECCYDTSGTLLSLLSFLAKGMARLVFIASESEHIHRLLPDVKRVKVPFLLARVNDHELFERLFHIKIISAYSGFHAFGKPVFNRNLIP
ncbi:hypothetical protein ERUR111494_08935 [Erysipelothrix urinaevulpis]|uniref:hypothetical protein n=1 Tax=Erysipelothrix urinaevulpis TaxID=2683717 RepID=UPI0013592D16|nr:hypothetical protein [Erysipelothrix urinaevulpis]